jgi:DNA-binding CsgD family transcriptional regulator
VAEHLASTPGAGTAAERAHHLRESNDLAGALTASLEAAEEARRVGAPAEQLQQLEAALALWRGVPDAAARAGRPQSELLMETAAAARRVGELHRAAALLRAALETLGPDGDPADRARAHYTLGQVLARIEDQTASLAESAAALALVPADPPSPVRTWAAATHARALYTSDRFEEATAVAEEALAAADELGLDSAWADTAVSLALMHGGNERQIMARVEEALGRARRSGDAEVEMRVLFYVAALTYEAGDVPGTIERAQVALDRACELGAEWSFYAAELRHLLVVARYVAGDWDGSLEMADRLARVPDMAAHVRAAALLVLVGRGDPAAAERLAWARGLTSRLDAHVLLGLATASAEIDLAAWAGDAATAVGRTREISRRLVEAWGDDRLATLRLDATALGAAADAAAAARLVGDTATADRWVGDAGSLADDARAAMAAYEGVAGEPSGVEGRAWMARVVAEEARLHGRADPALWRAAVDAFGYGHVYEQARSRWRLAEALMAADDRAAAAAEARRVHEVAVRLGAEPLRKAVEALARRGRLDIGLGGGASGGDPGAVLTPREAEVLALLAQGRTNRQIGATLYISEKTASVHVSNILAKFGAASRAEAVAIAAAKGLLTRVD